VHKVTAAKPTCAELYPANTPIFTSTLDGDPYVAIEHKGTTYHVHELC
jgi:hypothetical protein